jgi:NADPH:quinone reductase-like Zn-dependent oxidoreductase
VKALLSHASGGPETLRLEEVAEPQPGSGELLVRVRACSINYPDVLIIEDKYQLKPSRPFAPGSEIAGEVERLGEGVEGWSIGDRVIAATGFGGLAEKVVIPAARAITLPDERTFEQGSALLLTYATAIHALLDRGKLRTGSDPAGARRGGWCRHGRGGDRQGDRRAGDRRSFVRTQGGGSAGSRC